MAQQMINEQTFSAESIGKLSDGTAVTHRMSVGGTVLKSLVLFVLTCAFAAVGWSRVGTVIRATSGPSWLLGYFLLIALSFLAIANPRLAPLGGFVYAALMGLWVGAISKVYEAAYEGIVAPGYTDAVKFADGNPYGAGKVTGETTELQEPDLDAIDHLVTRVLDVAGRLAA